MSENLSRDLYAAADAGDLAAVQSLIAQGATTDWTDKSGETALMNAARNGSIEISDILIKNVADTNLGDNYGWCTPLLTAIESNNRLADKRHM